MYLRCRNIWSTSCQHNGVSLAVLHGSNARWLIVLAFVVCHHSQITQVVLAVAFIALYNPNYRIRVNFNQFCNQLSVKDCILGQTLYCAGKISPFIRNILYIHETNSIFFRNLCAQSQSFSATVHNFSK